MPHSLDRPLRAIDLFCGAGGLSQGFRDAGYEVPFALDFDADSVATYRANHPETHVEHASIVDFDPARITEIVDGPIDVVLGGPSCQSFSTAGRKSGWVSEDDERNDLWEHMFAIVEHVRPAAFLMENVPGMVLWRAGAFGDKILERFRGIGYNVTKEILLAADWGVPQRRRRLFIVGVRDGDAFAFPEPTHLGGWRRDTLELWEKRRRERGLLEHVTVADALSGLPTVVGEGESARYTAPTRATSPFARYIRRGSRVVHDHDVQSVGADTLELIEQIPAGGTWRDIPPHKLPDRYRGMRRTDSTNLLGRLDWALPSYTVTTQFNNVTTGCVTHPVEHRTLSVREGARLQTFPDTYRFVGSLQSRCRQIGNAVPPLLAHVLAYHLASRLDPAKTETHHRPAPVIKRSRAQANLGARRAARERARAAANQDQRAKEAVRAALTALDVPHELRRLELDGARDEHEIVIEGVKTVVLVKGCFLHGCALHKRDTKSVSKWWAERIAVAQAMDAISAHAWESQGFTVAEYWEHENPEDAARHVRELVDAAIANAADLLTSVVNEGTAAGHGR